MSDFLLQVHSLDSCPIIQLCKIADFANAHLLERTNALRLFHSNNKSMANAQKTQAILLLLERFADWNEPLDWLGLWRIRFQRERFKKLKI